MADPFAEIPSTAPVTVPSSPDQQEHQLVEEARQTTMLARRKKPRIGVGPFGKRIDLTPHINVRYELPGQSTHLGNPESMLTDEWKREHQGWHYMWPVRSSNQTAAYIRAKWFHPVPFDALNTDDPAAAVTDAKTAAGTYIVWMQHILVAIPPQIWKRLVSAYESLALSRMDNSGAQMEGELDALFSRGGFKAEINAYTDERAENIR